MSGSILPDPPADSELTRWVEDGARLEPSHSNVVAIDAPDEPYELRVQLDDPVHGYLIDLYDEDTRLARTVVDDCETAGQVAAELAAAAPELRELDERPGLGPERINRVEVEAEQESPPTPDEWDGQANEWENALQEAYDDAESHARRDRSSPRPSTAVTTTISSGVRVIPSPHNTSPQLSPQSNELYSIELASR